MRPSLLLYPTALAIFQVAMAIECPHLHIVNEPEVQQGHCVAINVCIDNSGSVSEYDGLKDCKSLLVALHCPRDLEIVDPNGSKTQCEHSILEIGDDGILKRTCCTGSEAGSPDNADHVDRLFQHLLMEDSNLDESAEIHDEEHISVTTEDHIEDHIPENEENFEHPEEDGLEEGHEDFGEPEEDGNGGLDSGYDDGSGEDDFKEL